MRFALDLSGHQKGINIPQLVAARQPIWAACKLTEAQGFIDSVSEGIVGELNDAGVVCSGYHYAWANRDPILQARHFAAREMRLPTTGRPVVDIEGVYDHRAGRIVDVPEVGPGVALATYRIMVEEIEQKTGRAAVIYTSPGFIASYFSRLVDSSDARALGERTLWVAHYGVLNPTVPLFWRSWAAWQYDGGKRERSPEGMPIDANWVADPAALGVGSGPGEVIEIVDPRGDEIALDEVLDLVSRPGGQHVT